MSWLLDADVLSQPAKRVGDARVIAWIEDQQDECYTSSIVIAQLAFWVRTKQGKPRDALQAWLTRLTDAMHGRVLGFNVSVAHVWAEQQHLLNNSRRPSSPFPRRHHLVLATGNDKDFDSGLSLHPFKELP